MVEIVDIEHGIEPLVACVEAFASATSRAERARLLGQLREHLEKLRTADEKVREELERGITETALLARENAIVKSLAPRIRSLQGYLNGTSQPEDPEAHQLLQTAINVIVGYLVGYQNIRDRLIRDAAEQRAVAGGVLHARPIAGEVDHEALSREFMARFPKIRAALAE